MPTNEHVSNRIAHLKCLHEEWLIQLQEVSGNDAEQARHIAEALDDLQVVIRRIEETPVRRDRP